VTFSNLDTNILVQSVASLTCFAANLFTLLALAVWWCHPSYC